MAQDRVNMRNMRNYFVHKIKVVSGTKPQFGIPVPDIKSKDF